MRDVAKKARDYGLVFRKSKDPVSHATVHKILRSRIYTGDFDFDGKMYRGTHVPLVSKDVWERAQEVMDHRFEKRHRKVKHDFAFSGLVECGHCGCSLVGEIKKGRYIYYHCTGYKGKCAEPYTREEVLEEQFADLLKRLRFEPDVLEWVKEGLKQSHTDEKREHDEAIGRLQAEYTRLQNRIDAMYLDKLDGRIGATFFDHKAAEWRAEQDRIQRMIQQHQSANQSYLEEGIHLLDLANRAYDLFRKQPPSEKRRLLNFVLSNCTWKGGELSVEFRQPFDMLAFRTMTHQRKKTGRSASDGQNENWLCSGFGNGR